MTTGIVLTENRHAGGFMVSEAPGRYSRDAVTIDQNQALVAGQILGIATAGQGAFAAAAAAAVAGNSGNGTVSAPSVGAGALTPLVGTYRIVAIAPTKFEVFDPAGKMVGEATAGSAFAGPIGFTITAGGAAFVAGDAFTVAVTETDPANAGKFVALGESAAPTNNTTASSSAVLHFAAVPAWVLAAVAAGIPVVVADATTAGVIAPNTTISSANATSVTMSGNALAGGVLSGDVITFTAQDGSQNAAGISWGNYTTGSGVTMLGTAIRREAEVRGVDLTYPAGATAAQISAANAQLLAVGIVVR